MTTKAIMIWKGIFLLVVLLFADASFGMRGYAKPLDADVAAGPRLTEARAIQIARDYCRKIGQSVTASGKATFPDVADYDADASWLPIWHVTFPLQADVNIVDRTGAIVSYSESGYFIRPTSYAPPGQALPKEDALRIARSALDVTGQKEELGNETATVRNSNIPPTYAGNEWFVKWDRMFHGVRFLYEGDTVTMNAQTGEIEAVIVSCPSVPVAGTEAAEALDRAKKGVGITPAQALGVGAEFLAAFRSAGMPPYRAFLREPIPLLRLVPPKDGWSHFQDSPGEARSARPAWVVRMLFRTDSSNEQDVWVDAETGEVLGEKHAAGGFGGTTQATAAPPPPSLAQMLQTAHTVSVLRRPAPTKEGWKAAPPLMLAGKDQAPALAALRATTDFRTDAPTGDAPQQVVLVGQDNTVAAYSYYPNTGLLGRDRDWAVAPAAFRAWAQTQTAAAPPKK